MSVNEGIVSDSSTVMDNVSEQKNSGSLTKQRKPVGNIVSRIKGAIVEVGSDVNSMAMLIDDANERATKPWYQRLPDD
jgi:hypothetical protein